MDYSVSKENTFAGRFFYFLIRNLFAPLIHFIWIKKITGRENLPKTGPYIIAANHQSYIDFICICAAVPEKINFLAAEKFFSSWFWRSIMELTGQIKVERFEKSNKEEVMRVGIDVLSHAGVLGIFPQGTRSRSGEIEKVHTGVAKFAILAKVPVIPIGIKGAFAIFPPHKKIPKIKKVIELHIGEPIYFDDLYNMEVSKEKYQEIANEIMKKIAGLSGKSYNI